jgi:hypothetical protein
VTTLQTQSTFGMKRKMVENVVEVKLVRRMGLQLSCCSSSGWYLKECLSSWSRSHLVDALEKTTPFSLWKKRKNFLWRQQ